MKNKILQISFLSCLCFSSVFAAQPGDAAPSCSVTKLETQQALNIDNYKGKVVYLDFWASWCSSCRLSFPILNKLHHELKEQGFEIIAINLDEQLEDAKIFLQNNPVDFSIVYDDEKKCPKNYQVMAMPSSYIIDKKGVIRDVHLGFKEQDVSKIRDKVLALLAE